MNTLANDEIQRRLKNLPGWSLTSQGIQKCFEMGDFPSVMNIVNRVADLAQEANHHPDIYINYDRVTFSLITHDAGGVTDKDFDFARRIEAIAP